MDHVRFGLAGLMLGLSITFTPPIYAQPANDCLAPYWQDTLRCAAFPADPPQANFNTQPNSPSQVKAFTRVFLNDNLDVRCLDGTRPGIYVDKAICADGANCTYDQPVESNKWIISMTGGGSCNAHDSDGDGVFDDGQTCLDTYAQPNERDEMGTALEPPMKTFEGINRPNPLENPTFAGYNRVLVEKCSYDRYNGRVAYEAAGGFFHETGPTGATVDFNMYQQGYLIMEKALATLQSGLAYTTWTVSGAGGGERVVEAQESLPPLADAVQVLFVGHSDSAHGLYHNIDHLAASLAAIGFTGDVRAVFDANFTESIENEAAFATDATETPLAGDAYSNIWSGATTGDGVPFAYDGATHHTAGPFAEQYNSWNMAFDSSCLTAHATTGDDWKCRDRAHVLFNHIATPFFIREDFSDPNQEHTNNGLGHPVVWADETSWASFAYCPPDHNPCPPTFSVPLEHRTRLSQQFQTLLDGSLLRSELATGADPSLSGTGLFPSWFAWMPNCGVHNGAYADASFFDTTMTYLTYTYSMQMFLRDFVSVGRTDLRGWYVDGWSDGAGNVMTTTACH
jgi:hypothetical protein